MRCWRRPEPDADAGGIYPAEVAGLNPERGLHVGAVFVAGFELRHQVGRTLSRNQLRSS